MSSILHQNIKVIRMLAFTTFFLFSFINYFNFDASILLYLIFTFVSFLCLKKIFDFQNSFGFIMISTLVLLGFWFKFSTVIIFFDSDFGEGVGYFDFSRDEINSVLIVSIIFKLSLLFSYYVFKKFNIKEYQLSFENIEILFFRRLLLYISLILIFILFICFVNFTNKIFVRTFEFNQNYFLLKDFFKLFFKILAPFLIYFFLDLIFKFNKDKENSFFYIFILIFVLNVIYASQLSREVGIHILIIIYSFLLIKEKNLTENVKKFYGLLIISFILCFIASLNSIQLLRALTVLEPLMDTKKFVGDIITNVNSNNIALFINRWVGIDAVMAIVSSNEKGWELLLNISNNQINWTTEVAWPMTEYFQDKVHVNTPGPAAFLYSSGSFIFLFFLSFIIFFFFFILETFIILINKNFLLASNFLIFILAYRIMHIGLGINNLIYFILAILLIVFFLIIVNQLLKFK